MKGGWLYIMANRYRGTMYIGVTASLPHRAMQHREAQGSGFAAKYGCAMLVYAERYNTIEEAILREKRMKKWNREWKIELIEKQNPEWEDRFDELI
ncbi:MAG: GIY-YIG nuclease family protein [Pseudomonadota bacterium]